MRAFQVDVETFFDAVAVTGRADHGAGAAAQALVAPFLPYRGVELDVEENGQAGHLDIGLEAVLDRLAPFDQEAVVFVRRLFDLNSLRKANALEELIER